MPTQPDLEFLQEEDLLDSLRLAHDEGKRIVLLLGSALTAPTTAGAPGVPGVRGMIELIRDAYRDMPRRLAELDRALATCRPEDAYQTAFQAYHGDRNQIIRRGVLKAYLGPPPRAINDARCQALESDLTRWSLSPAVASLGVMLAADLKLPLDQQRFGHLLTPNFDPLIEIAIRRAEGIAKSIALAYDGSLGDFDAADPLQYVIHFHGFWRNSVTLHDPRQLARPRPNLEAALRRLLRTSEVVVMGCGGWDDVFLRAVHRVLEVREDNVRLHWCFHRADPAQIQDTERALLARLDQGERLINHEVLLYRGIDLHQVLPRMAQRLSGTPPPSGAGRISRTGSGDTLMGTLAISAALMGTPSAAGAAAVPSMVDTAQPAAPAPTPAAAPTAPTPATAPTAPAAVAATAPAPSRAVGPTAAVTHSTAPVMGLTPATDTSRPLVLLHISDLHIGQPGTDDGTWASARDEFLRDLREQTRTHGAPDIILFTGDLAHSGVATQYQDVQQELERIKSAVGGAPAIVAIPGNHDLNRKAIEGESTVLAAFHTNPSFQAAVKAGTSTVSNVLLKSAFAGYLDFFQTHIVSTWGAEAVYEAGKLPGAFTVIIERAGFRVGIAGMNSAFLQLSGDPPGQEEHYMRKLAVGPWQLAKSAVGEWCARQDANLLLMHHPLIWLQERSADSFASTLYVRDSFVACLCGHRHKERFDSKDDMLFLQGSSLFGREWANTAHEKHEMGYAWMHLHRDSPAAGRLKVTWRSARLADGGRWGFYDVPASRTWPIRLNPPRPPSSPVAIAAPSAIPASPPTTPPIQPVTAASEAMTTPSALLTQSPQPQPDDEPSSIPTGSHSTATILAVATLIAIHAVVHAAGVAILIVTLKAVPVPPPHRLPAVVEPTPNIVPGWQLQCSQSPAPRQPSVPLWASAEISSAAPSADLFTASPNPPSTLVPAPAPPPPYHAASTTSFTPPSPPDHAPEEPTTAPTGGPPLGTGS